MAQIREEIYQTILKDIQNLENSNYLNPDHFVEIVGFILDNEEIEDLVRYCEQDIAVSDIFCYNRLSLFLHYYYVNKTRSYVCFTVPSDIGNITLDTNIDYAFFLLFEDDIKTYVIHLFSEDIPQEFVIKQ